MKAILTAVFVIMHFGAVSQNANPSPFSKVIIDNDNVKVTSFEGNPGKDVCGMGKHSHGAHLTVLLTDANFTITTPDGKTTSQKALAGTTFWSDPETHIVINSGTTTIKAQVIEYKKKK